MRLIGAPVARVAAPPQRALLRPPDERAGRVDEHQVQGLGEQVAIPEEQLALEVGPARRQEAAHRPVEMLKFQLLDARALNGAQPAHALEVAARRAQALERQREAGALEVEAEAASAGQAREDLGHALLLPQAAENQRRAPGPGGMGLQAVVADALHDAQLRAELGQAADEVVQGPRRHQLVAPAEGGDQALPDLALLAEGLDDLEVLAGSVGGATTFEAHEHEPIMRSSDLGHKHNRRARPDSVPLHFRLEAGSASGKGAILLRSHSASRDQTVENEARREKVLCSSR